MPLYANAHPIRLIFYFLLLAVHLNFKLECLHFPPTSGSLYDDVE